MPLRRCLLIAVRAPLAHRSSNCALNPRARVQFPIALAPCRTFLPLVDDPYSSAHPPPAKRQDRNTILPAPSCGGAERDDGSPGPTPTSNEDPVAQGEFGNVAFIGRPGESPAVPQAPRDASDFAALLRPEWGRVLMGPVVEDVGAVWRYAVTLFSTNWSPGVRTRLVLNNATLWAGESLEPTLPLIQQAWMAGFARPPLLCYDRDLSGQECVSAGSTYIYDVSQAVREAGVPALVPLGEVQDGGNSQPVGYKKWIAPAVVLLLLALLGACLSYVAAELLALRHHALCCSQGN